MRRTIRRTPRLPGLLQDYHHQTVMIGSLLTSEKNFRFVHRLYPSLCVEKQEATGDLSSIQIRYNTSMSHSNQLDLSKVTNPNDWLD